LGATILDVRLNISQIEKYRENRWAINGHYITKVVEKLAKLL